MKKISKEEFNEKEQAAYDNLKVLIFVLSISGMVLGALIAALGSVLGMVLICAGLIGFTLGFFLPEYYAMSLCEKRIVAKQGGDVDESELQIAKIRMIVGCIFIVIIIVIACLTADGSSTSSSNKNLTCKWCGESVGHTTNGYCDDCYSWIGSDK